MFEGTKKGLDVVAEVSWKTMVVRWFCEWMFCMENEMERGDDDEGSPAVGLEEAGGGVVVAVMTEGLWLRLGLGNEWWRESGVNE